MDLVDLGDDPRPDMLYVGVALIGQLTLDELTHSHLLQPSEVILLIEGIKPLIKPLLNLLFPLYLLPF